MATSHRAARKFKVVLLGEGRVGKTSILLRYIKNEYDDRQVSTLQASYLDTRLLVDSTPVQLSLWDTAGQERFRALGPIYYRDADGALLVYDITDDESFQKVRTWVRELRRMVGDDIDIVIAGNKSDLQRNRKVDDAAAQAYAASVGATHFTTSAKLNRNLENVFVDLTKRMLAHRVAQKSTKSALIADDDADDDVPRSSASASANANANATRAARAKTTSSAGANTASASASAAGLRRSEAASSGHARQPVRIMNEDDDVVPPRSPASDTLRIRGGSQQARMEAAKSKSGCC